MARMFGWLLATAFCGTAPAAEMKDPPELGISAGAVRDWKGGTAHFPEKPGALILSVEKWSAAAAAGVTGGSIIHSANGTPVASPSDLEAALRDVEAGEEVTLDVSLIERPAPSSRKPTAWKAPASVSFKMSSRGRRALASMETKTDRFTKTVYYRGPEAAGKRLSPLRAVFARDDSGRWSPLTLNAKFDGEMWIFASQVLIKIDERDPVAFKVEPDRTAGAGGGENAFTGAVPPNVLDHLNRHLPAATRVTLRFQGRESADVELRPEEIEALCDSLLAHQLATRSP